MPLSNKLKRRALKKSRAGRRAQEEHRQHRIGLKRGTIIPVDPTRIFSRSVLPDIPEFYRDKWFDCRDCGTQDLWTAKQQQRWHEEQGGEIETTAIRCRTCRRRERERKAEARRVHFEGPAKKQASKE